MRVQKKFKKPRYDKLNLGCGNDIKKGYVNLDIVKLPGVDVVHDLNKFPWPFPDNSFREILCYNILEHLDDLVRVMKEIYRISKKKARVKIIVPHFSSADSYSDPTHKRTFSTDGFNFFTKEFKKYYHTPLFKIIRCEIAFPSRRFFMKWFANRFKGFYDYNLAFIFPADGIIFELEPLK